jgi:phosphotransferase family enzyme
MQRGRLVTLVLVAPDGTALGVLPSFTVKRPYWPEVAEVLEACHALYGAQVTILRLLDAEADPGQMMGGRITYVAELDGPPPAEIRPWTGRLPDDPLRARWARPGGAAGDLAWADARLVEAGRPRTGTAAQVKTWNLSSIWRLPTASGDVWLKAVPPFFAHEGAMMHALAAPAVPPLIAFDDLGRTLMEDVPGVDQYTAPSERQAPMIDALVALQAGAVGRVDELLATGAPDWRAAGFAIAAADVVARGSGTLTADERSELDRLIDGLDRRFASLARCGIPDTFVHGDFHTGNVRWTEAGPVIFDWGDTGIGHPLLDLPPFDRNLEVGDRPAARARWVDQWTARAPGSDPERAIRLIEPLGALRLAIVYQRFLDGIERTERRYHEADVPAQLRDAARLATEERS